MKLINTFLSYVLVAFLLSASAFAQVTTNSGSGLAATYGSLAAAITALNGATITSPVEITLTGNETSPAGGYSITATGTASNTILIQGSSSTITAFTPQTAGLQTDAIFKIVGGDYITIQNFTMQENAGNTVTAQATNTMTEFGVGLYLTTATNGAQNNTIQNNTISLGATYQNAIGIFSTSSSSVTNGALAATSSAGTNSNNKFYSNTISNVAYGMYFISEPMTATIFETGIDIGGASGATANTITFGNATTATLTWTRFSTTQPAGIAFRNGGAGNTVRFNSITSNNLTYAQSGGIGGIVVSVGTAATGVTYTSNWSNNTITLSNLGITAITGIDFGYGLSTGTIVSSNNAITVNQTSSAANTAVAIGIKANYASATNTCNSNTVVLNISSSAGALSGAATGMTLAGTSTTNTANSNNITINQTGSGTGTITSTTTALSVAGAATTINALTNTILVNQTTSVATGITTGTISGILANAVATTVNVTTTNVITIKQAVTGAGTYGTNPVTYINVSAASGTINVTDNTLNTTGSTIRSTGNLIGVNQNATVTVLVNVKGNTMNVDRVAASGTTVTFQFTSGTPSEVADTVSSNNITFTGLAGTTAVTGISSGGGPISPVVNNKRINNNTINISGTHTGASIGITSSFTNTGFITGNSITISSASAAVTGITTSSTAVTLSGNTLSLTSTSTAPTSMVGIAATSTTGGHSITANTFTAMNFSGIITTSPTVSGISIAGGTSANVFSNTVTNITVGAATSSGNPIVDGILVSGGVSVNVFKNKIYGIVSNNTGTTGVVNGIRISGGGTTGNTYYNNLIGDLTAPASTNPDAVRGISITSAAATTTNNVFYNTVRIAATSSGVNFGTSGIFHAANATAGTAALNLRNNIIVNNTTPNGTGLSVAFRRSAADLANYAGTSNNNDFFAPTIMHNGTAYTMPTFKTLVAPRDAASFTENATFVSTTGSSNDFLHINTVTPTQIESGGATVAGITDDFDGHIRHGEVGYAGGGSAPDVGADEFTGTGLDLSPPAISYTLLGNGVAAGSRLFSNVTITDASGVNFTSGLAPRVYYKKSTDDNAFTGNTSGNNGWKFVETADVTSPVAFTIDYSLLQSAVIATDMIQYFVVAQDVAPSGPFVGINSGTFAATPSSVDLTSGAFPIGGTINSYIIANAITGPYNVGAGQTYTTLTAAGGFFAFVNANVLTGNVVVNIVSNITETGVNALNQWAEDGAGNYTLTIQPDAATTRTLSGTFAGGLIRLNGADRVTIDGRSGGSGRFLTFSNASTAINTAAIQVISLGTGLGAVNNTIRNCNIAAGSNTVTSTFGIFVGSATISTAGTGADNDNLTILNNSISKAYYGIYARGTAGVSSGGLDGLNISSNSIGSETAADYVIFRGADVQGAVAPAISGNTIFNLIHATAVNNAAIDLGANVNDAIVSKNLIRSIKSTSTSGYGAYGINISATTTNNIRIDNNVIYDIITSNYSETSTTFNAFGIRITGGTNHKVYYNSVNLFGPVTGGTVAGMSAAFIVTVSTATGLDVRDNIFANSTAFAISGAKSYAAYVVSGTVFGTINYNDYFASGTYGILGFYAADVTTIGAWRTASTQDANSIAANPQFASNTDLRPGLGTPVLLAGTAIAGLTTDYLGVTRHASTPTIGAYEEGVDVSGPAIAYTALGNTTSTADRPLPNVAITDASGVDWPNSPRVYYKKSTDANVFASNTSGDNGWKWTTANNWYANPTDFTINYALLQSAVIAGDIIQYFVVAQDLVGTPNVSSSPSTGFVGTSVSSITSAPTTPNSYIIANAITGTYNVGAGQTYTTLTAAGGFFAFVNANVLTGNVVVNIVSNITETGANALNQWAEDGAGNYTLTIQPDSHTDRLISGSNAASIIKLNGADRVTIEGSFEGHGKHLTFENTNTGTSSAVIWVGSASLTNGATDNTIRNCIVRGNAPLTTFMGIFAGHGTTMGSAAEAANSNLSILNNTFIKSSYGIAVAGNTAGQTGLVVNDNVIGSSTVADYIGFIGMFFSNQNGASVNRNSIQNIITTATNPVGVNISGNVINSSFSRNLISGIRYTLTSGYGGKGIDINTGSATSNLSIVNNVIYDISGDGYITGHADAIYGIRIRSSQGGINLYYNSVNMFGDISRSGATADESYSLYIGSAVTSLNIRNNVLVNSINNTTGVATAFAIYSASANTAFTNINYNDYFVSGPEGILGFLASNRTTIAAWRTASAQDGYSVSGNPGFTSATNLLPDTSNANSWTVANKAVHIAAVTTDFAGIARPAVALGTPDIGAYEFGNPTAAPTPVSFTPGSGSNPVLVNGLQICDVNFTTLGGVTNIATLFRPGVTPPGVGGYPGAKFYNGYLDIQQTDGVGFTYNFTFNYDEAQLGTISSESLIRLAKSDDGGTIWTAYLTPGTGPGQYALDTIANTITVRGLNSFSLFTLTDHDAPLPVELSIFAAEVKKRDVFLNWETKTEINAFSFEVQRSSEDGIWSKVGEVKAHGNSNSPKQYSLTDKKLNSGQYSYRLKMIDNDGVFEYSKVVETEISLPKEYALSQNYPNPFNPSARIDYQLPENSNVLVEIYAITGERVTQLVNMEQEAGYYTLNVNANSLRLSSGVYIYRLTAKNTATGEQFLNVKKMMLMK